MFIMFILPSPLPDRTHAHIRSHFGSHTGLGSADLSLAQPPAQPCAMYMYASAIAPESSANAPESARNPQESGIDLPVRVAQWIAERRQIAVLVETGAPSSSVPSSAEPEPPPEPPPPPPTDALALHSPPPWVMIQEQDAEGAAKAAQHEATVAETAVVIRNQAVVQATVGGQGRDEIVRFGKMKGCRFQEVFENQPYAQWVVDNQDETSPPPFDDLADFLRASGIQPTRASQPLTAAPLRSKGSASAAKPAPRSFPKPPPPPLNCNWKCEMVNLRWRRVVIAVMERSLPLPATRISG